MGVGEGAPARGVGAGEEGRGGRAVRLTVPAACGWSPTPTCPAPRPWPGSSSTASGSSWTSSASTTTRPGCRTPSASPRDCPRSSRPAYFQVPAHAEDLLVPHQQLPAPHLPLGGHRRHPDLHPLPARRHLQLLHARRRDRPRRTQLQGQGHSPALPRAHRLGRRGRRHHPRDGRQGRPAPRPRGIGHGHLGDPVRVLRQGRGGEPRAARVGRRAVPRTAPRHAHQPGRAPSRATGAASTSCGRPSCGRPPPPCAPASPTRTPTWTGSGRRCCCTSSTTSCPAPPSPGCTARPAPPTPGSPTS